MNISISAQLILVTAIIIISLDVVIIIGSKNLSSRVFALLSFITALWVTSQTFFVSTLSSELSEQLIRFQYCLGIFISIGFYHFSKIYPQDKRPSLFSIFVSVITMIFFSYIFVFTDLIISGTVYIGGIGKWGWNFGNLHWIFELSFCGLWILALKNLYLTYRQSSGAEYENFKYMFWALFLGIIPPTLFNIILPVLGYYSLNWFGPLCSAIWIFIIAHSIIKYRQMDVRAVVTEVLAIGMTVLFFINIFLQVPSGIWGRIAPFIIFMILAFYLIRGVLREARQKEELATLNNKLAQKVMEQTAEIRHALELEKNSRRELEKLNETKNQFILITQHHLRVPTSTMKSQIEFIAKDENITNPLTQKALDRAEMASKRLTHIVDEFLSITEIKPGGAILKMSRSSMLPLIEEILSELEVEIQAKNISVSYSKDREHWPELNIDITKMREVILIVVENAIKYNHQNGTIDIVTKTDGQQFLIKVENTGIGISVDELSKVGKTTFFRGKEARKANSLGMGVGLNVARTIVRAHHGELSIDSEGEGSGARVTVVIQTRS